MAGYENIRNKGFDHRSTEELREIQSRGGKNSGKARRKRANFNKTLNALLTAEVDSEEWKPVLEALGLECTLESAMLMSQIKKAMQGDTKAAYFVAQYAGQSGKSERDLEEQQSKVELNRARKSAITGENETDEALERLDQILKEVQENAIKRQAE